MKIDVRISIITNSDDGDFFLMSDEESRIAIKSLQECNGVSKSVLSTTLGVAYDLNYSIRDLNNDIYSFIGIEMNNNHSTQLLPIMIKAGNMLMQIRNTSMKLRDFVSAFQLEEIDAYLLVIYGYGDYLREEGFRFFFPSHEGNRHNKPHVHVETNDYRGGSIDIVNLRKLEGNINSREEKKIRKILKGRERELLNAWNLMTDGIDVDVDYLLGLKRIKYND